MAEGALTLNFLKANYPLHGYRWYMKSRLIPSKLSIQHISTVFLLLIYAGFAFGHAIILESTPKDGAVLSAPPNEILLRFNSRIEKEFAKVKILRSDGRVFPASVVTNPAGAAGFPDRLLIAVPRLESGSYNLQYQVLASDGHTTQGLLRFTIR